VREDQTVGRTAAGTEAPALPRLPPPPRLPGRARLGLWSAGCLALCGLVVLAVVATGSADAAVAALALPLSQLPGPLIRRIRLRHLGSTRRHRTLADDPALAALASGLRPYGIRELTVRAGPTRGLAHAYRSGGRAVVLVHESLLPHPEPAAFFLAHEIGHVVRHDSLRRPLVITTLLTCWLCGSLAAPLAAVGLVPVVLLIAAFNWTMELDCDRIATRWAGPGAAERAMRVLQLAHQQSRRPAILARRLWLTHPPLALRLAVVRGAGGRTS
jgi:Zn-dependent protease with chaperone function